MFFRYQLQELGLLFPLQVPFLGFHVSGRGVNYDLVELLVSCHNSGS